MILPVTSEMFASLNGVAHGFFTRRGGVSEGIYASLNVAYGSEDAREVVEENRRRVADALGVMPNHLVTLSQVHSARCLTIASPDDAGSVMMQEADALVCNQPGVAIGILTADCAPILFADAAAGVVGAAHAGWKGAISGVIAATLEAMESLGAQRDGVQVAVGPCIAQASYEVDGVFRDRFVEQNPDWEAFFVPSTRDAHWQFDLKGFCVHQCHAAELSDAQIDCLPQDTYADEETFFSYRRKTHRAEPDYGRQISVIVVK